MEHLLKYTFEWQSLIFIAVALLIMHYFGILKLIASAYKDRGTSQYKSERWHLHTIYTRYGCAVVILLMSFFPIFQIIYWPIVAAFFAGLIFGATANYLRERYMMKKSGVKPNGDPVNPVDLNDVLHGAVGGMEGTVLGVVLSLAIFFVTR